MKIHLIQLMMITEKSLKQKWLIYRTSFRLIFCSFFISLNYKKHIRFFMYVCKIENALLHGSTKNVIFYMK